MIQKDSSSRSNYTVKNIKGFHNIIVNKTIPDGFFIDVVEMFPNILLQLVKRVVLDR